jgi:hypothetical protein
MCPPFLLGVDGHPRVAIVCGRPEGLGNSWHKVDVR